MSYTPRETKKRYGEGHFDTPDFWFYKTDKNYKLKTAQVTLGLLDDPDPNVRAKGSKIIMDSVYVKPDQNLNLSNPDGTLKQITPVIVSSPEVKSKVEKILSGELKRGA